MSQNNFLVLFLVVALLGYAVFADKSAANANTLTIQSITTTEAKALYTNPDYILLDVRTTAEVAERSIPGALNIPLHELEKRAHELPTDKTLLVICRSGNRSRTAVELLGKLGFSKLYNVSGGINAWPN